MGHESLQEKYGFIRGVRILQNGFTIKKQKGITRLIQPTQKDARLISCVMCKKGMRKNG